MAETKVIMPQMGESIFEGTITKWLKKKGERIERDEPLFEISTDKIDTEIPSPASGFVEDILVNEGQTVQINTVVAVIGDTPGKPGDGKAKDTPKKEEPPIIKGPAPVAGPTAEIKAEEAQTQETAAPRRTEPPSASQAEDEIRSSPLVRRIAKEYNIDLSALAGKGTGIDGRITKSDILSYVEQAGKEPEPAPQPPKTDTAPAQKTPVPQEPASSPIQFTGDVQRVPLTPMRKAIAEHMVMSRRTSAHVTTFFEVDCARILKAKENQQAEFERTGVRLTVTPFFVQAVASALKRFSIVNSSLEGDTVVYRRPINVGIAVNLEWGLIVPVIKNADEKSLLGLAKAINDLGSRARNKKLTPEDVKDGTFTITNPGQYGSLIGTPIINQPQVAILGMGGIKKRVVVIDDAIAIRPMIILSLSFDHRVIDGATADQFMADIQKQLENWPV
jgi:2-oxoglutarate dehydrogenase E2 component (dihydrolipoamide succinyltransferase)